MFEITDQLNKYRERRHAIAISTWDIPVKKRGSKYTSGYIRLYVDLEFTKDRLFPRRRLYLEFKLKHNTPYEERLKAQFALSDLKYFLDEIEKMGIINPVNVSKKFYKRHRRVKPDMKLIQKIQEIRMKQGQPTYQYNDLLTYDNYDALELDKLAIEAGYEDILDYWRICIDNLIEKSKGVI